MTFTGARECSGATCRAQVAFFPTPAGAQAVLDVEPSPAGNIALELEGNRHVARTLKRDELEKARAAGATLYVSHWATCIDAKTFRNKPRRSPRRR